MELTFKKGIFEDAAKVRQAVFVEEQGFEVEFEESDQHPDMIHVTAYDPEGALVGCARVFPAALEPNIDDVPGRWVFGRLAVFPDRREGGIGSQILAAAEQMAAEAGATEIQLHAQCHAIPFYERVGYVAWGPIELDEHVEHQWMGKQLSASDEK
ncbi:MAG: GNAT family N-acetyltransferase [Adlercreutzia sp.]|nr:GNAT family N-acetyltransferase [Adlercreutzia sp.]